MMAHAREILRRVLTTQAAWPVLLAVTLLCAAGVLAIRGSWPDAAERAVRPAVTQAAAVAESMHGADKQLLFIALGAVLVLLSLLPHYIHAGRLSWAFYGVVLVLLAAVLATDKINGARRWFSLPGFQLQPSELAKLAFVLVLAWHLHVSRNIREFHGLIVPLLLALVPFGLIFVEPDLGTALLFPLVMVAVLIAAGARLRHLGFLLLLAIVAVPTFYPLLRDYHKERLLALRPQVRENPEYRRGAGYQQYVSIVAHGSGGLKGEGDEGAYMIRKGLLPEAHTDFVFACIGARWGFLGCALVIAMYLAFFSACAEIAASSNDPFARLTVVGLSSMILFQAIINMAMTAGLAPVVGIALPFVSYGGSSLLTNMLAVGILLNVSVRRRNKMNVLRGDLVAT